MRRKYLAFLLGMALSLTSVCAFAEEETETDTYDVRFGRVEAVVSDSVILVSAGELVEDESDSTLATLTLDGIIYELTFADDATGAQLVEQKTVTIEEASEDAVAETETELAETTDDAEEETGSDTDDAADTDAEEETETETETEEETEETEEISLADLQVGDIIEYTIHLDGEDLVVSFTLVGAEG
ncbi:MAG: hypothetical protein LUF27_12770 [Lachnospiraceae bacterium]|nr:hypothetical protein [Lachnospiraceae bacterium]